MLITFYDSYTILKKVYSGSYLKQAILDTDVRESSRPHTNKICYGVLDKNITLDYILSCYTKKQPKLPIKILLKIGLYSIIYLKTPPHLVVDTLVELAKKLGKGGASGFINGLLRSYLKKGYELPTDKIKNASIKYSKPEFLVGKIFKDYGDEIANKILNYDEENTFIRFNNGVDGEKYLTENGVSFIKTPFSDCFLVNGFKMNGDFYSGIYTFQSIGSVAICNAIEKGDNLLDCCSAPGGKAVYLADKFNKVLACDVHLHRVDLIKSYIERMNKNNVETKRADMAEYNEELDGKFEVVLCDAPCSGTGVIKDNPDININRTYNDILSLTKLQQNILNTVCKYVKVGGCLYYSTCSILKDENDRQIKEFLKNNDGFKVEKVDSLLNNLKCEYGVQFLPYLSSGAGFYLAKLRREK